MDERRESMQVRVTSCPCNGHIQQRLSAQKERVKAKLTQALIRDAAFIELYEDIELL